MMALVRRGGGWFSVPFGLFGWVSFGLRCGFSWVWLVVGLLVFSGCRVVLYCDYVSRGFGLLVCLVICMWGRCWGVGLLGVRSCFCALCMVFDLYSISWLLRVVFDVLVLWVE